jgi:hypothetical protein
VIGRLEGVAHRTLSVLAAAGALAAGGPASAPAQDTTAFDRGFLLEVRAGTTEALGATTKYLVGPDAAIGVTFAFQLERRWWGWVSGDYKPENSSVAYLGPGMSPRVGLYTLTAGVSRTFGLPFGLVRWRPFELGLGVGATQAQFQSTAQSQAGQFPPDAQFEDVFSSDLMESSRWRPSAAARLRIAVPVLRAVRLSVTAAVVATRVGDVRLWDGGWEATGEGSRYRPTSETWSYGTIFTVPLTVGVGLRF